jgi:DNA-directed RNA polymerase specialized sigma subunit
MDIVYQYYNEISLFFADYDTDFQDGRILIYTPENGKSFESVVKKAEEQILRIADTLEEREKEVVILVVQGSHEKEIRLYPNPGEAGAEEPKS